MRINYTRVLFSGGEPIWWHKILLGDIFHRLTKNCHHIHYNRDETFMHPPIPWQLLVSIYSNKADRHRQADRLFPLWNHVLDENESSNIRHQSDIDGLIA